MAKLLKVIKNVYHELDDRLYVEFEPTQRHLPYPIRPPLNLQPIPSSAMLQFVLPEYNDEPPPPYTDETR